MAIRKVLTITSATGVGWSNTQNCYDKSDTSSATVESGQGQELSLSVNTSNVGDLQIVSSAVLKITSSCWYVDNNFFDITTNVSSTVIGKVPISTTKSTYTLDITEVVKSNQLSTLKLRPYASSAVYETTIELFEVRIEIIIDDGTGTNSLFFGGISVDNLFFGNSEVSSIYLGDTLVYGK
ncbi:hypothetical protein H9L25_00940 [Terrisporobacter mayombei]|nr:hypothetical protein [Terrisporobacter mayombei]